MHSVVRAESHCQLETEIAALTRYVASIYMYILFHQCFMEYLFKVSTPKFNGLDGVLYEQAHTGVSLYAERVSL